MSREHDRKRVDEQEREFRNGRPVTRSAGDRDDQDDDQDETEDAED